MPGTRIRLVCVALAAGLMAAASAAVPAQASSASYSVTIAAKVKIPAVTGYKYVLYKGTHGYGTARIQGQVTGASAEDVVTLLAKPFGARHFTPLHTLKLTTTTGSQSYAFRVRPTTATAYEAQVTTGTVVDATSAVQTVYVALSAARYKWLHDKCGPRRCVSTLKAWINVPASAYKTETRKHTYLYAAVGYPKVPSVYTRSSGTVSRRRKISATEYEFTIRWYIKLSATSNTNWRMNWCEKDTESLDGMNLPGHHDCGRLKVSVKQADIYIG
jgi:hypothetical protein